MSFTSRTGLTASPTKKIHRYEQAGTVQLKAIARRAPYVLKPFAGLYNPYPYGCSLLCNHPTDSEAKELLKKAKDSWATEGKNLLLAEEIEAIRAGLQQLKPRDEPGKIGAIESVPEELFRRYTETDSRPLTPAPTLASAATRASGSRRCVTPDPAPTNEVREKTLLILDLRRSHSQETLSWFGSSSLEPPIIRIQKAPTRSGSFEDVKKSPKYLAASPPKSPKKKSVEEFKEEKKSDDDGDDDEEFVKRRGKKRRKKREGSRGPPAFQSSLDPETQVATIGVESHNPSARPSLVPSDEGLDVGKDSANRVRKSLDIDSYLDTEILKQLRRELNEEIIENEFNSKRRKALEEALKTVQKDKPQCEELAKLQRELNLPPVNSELWLSLPRIFSRANARFELPLDSRTLQGMTPLQYLRDNVSISSPSKLLYNCIFNKFKIDTESEEEHQERRIAGNQLQPALDLVMGKAMKETQRKYFRDLINWKDDDLLDFKTFCGLCAVSERLLAPQYYPRLPDRKSDPCHEIETADFEALPRKLYSVEVARNLVEVLEGIHSL